MKKTTNISISGIAFTIEMEAYDLLTNYTKTLEGIYKNSPDGREIIDDIEARIAELILSWQQTPSTPVTLVCIQDIIDQLGLPDESQAEGEIPNYNEEGTPLDSFETHPKDKITKRFYRNPDGALIGGVVNGMAIYTAIDVTWLRIAAVALAILSIPLHCAEWIAWMSIAYVILLFIVPKAKTPRQKLEMKGNPITISTLENSFKETMDNISDNPRNKKSASIFADIVYGIGRIIRALLKVFAAIIGVSILVSIIAAIIGGIFIAEKGQYSMEILTTVSPIWAAVIFVVGLVAPLSFILYIFIRMIFNLPKMNRIVISSIIGVWVISWLIAAALITKNALDFSSSESIQTTVNLPASDTLYIKSSEVDFNKLSIMDNMDVGPDQNWTKRVHISTVKSTDKAYMVIRRYAKGKYSSDAMENAEKIPLPYRIQGDTLYISPVFSITRQMMYHNQRMNIELHIPESTTLVTDDIIDNYYTLTDHLDDRQEVVIGDSDSGEITITGNENEGSFTVKTDSETVNISASKDKVKMTVSKDKRGQVTKREVININK